MCGLLTPGAPLAGSHPASGQSLGHSSVLSWTRIALCPTSNSETSQLSFPETWLPLATQMVARSWGKSKSQRGEASDIS